MSHKSGSKVHPIFSEAAVFTGLSGPDLADVAAYFSRRAFASGTFLFFEGDPARIFYLIAEGQLKILQSSPEGFEVILHMFGPGELVGALPTLGEGTYPASAQALSEVVAFAVSAEDFQDMLRRYPIAALNLLRFAAGRLQAAHRKLREMATERVERRIARTLARLASQVGRRTDDGIVLDAPMSRQDLAEMTGTSLFTVSRTLKAWERQGILRARRKQVIILEPHALAIIAHDFPHPDRKT